MDQIRKLKYLSFQGVLLILVRGLPSTFYACKLFLRQALLKNNNK